MHKSWLVGVRRGMAVLGSSGWLMDGQGWDTEGVTLAVQLREVLDANSGGMKLIALMCALAERDYLDMTDPDTPDKIFRAIQGSADMAMLDYGWEVGPGLWREKHFIYRVPPHGRTNA